MPPASFLARGTADKGTQARLGADPVLISGGGLPAIILAGERNIPEALAHALRWQAALDRLADDDFEDRQEVASNLLRVFGFLFTIAQLVATDPADGALLYADPLRMFAESRGVTRIVETADGMAIPVTQGGGADSLFPWAPASVPQGWGPRERALYPARPRAVTDIPPFDSAVRFGHLLSQAAWLPSEEAAPAPRSRAPAMPASTRPMLQAAALPARLSPVSKKASDAAAAEAEAQIDWGTPAEQAEEALVPLVGAAKRLLRRTTVVDLRQATDAKLAMAYEDDALIEHLEVLLYHSVHTIVLDRDGEPNTLSYGGGPGYLDYGILLPLPGSQMRRFLPPSGGINVSVGRSVDYAFRIENGTIVKDPSGGVGAFQEYGFGASYEHPLQVMIKAYMANRQGYIASVTAMAGTQPAALDVGIAYLKLSDLAEATYPYLITQLKLRLKARFENWQELLVEMVRDTIIQIIRDKVVEFVIKRVGAELVPVLDAVVAAYDAITSSGANTRMRYAVACGMIALRGQTREDTELAARVMSRICADEIDDRIMQQLAQQALKMGKRLVHRAPKDKGHSQTHPPAAHAAADEGAPAASASSVREPTAGRGKGWSVTDPLDSGQDAGSRTQAHAYVRKMMQEGMENADATNEKTTDRPAVKPKTQPGFLNPSDEDIANVQLFEARDAAFEAGSDGQRIGYKSGGEDPEILPPVTGGVLAKMEGDSDEANSLRLKYAGAQGREADNRLMNNVKDRSKRANENADGGHFGEASARLVPEVGFKDGKITHTAEKPGGSEKDVRTSDMPAAKKRIHPDDWKKLHGKTVRGTFANLADMKLGSGRVSRMQHFLKASGGLRPVIIRPVTGEEQKQAQTENTWRRKMKSTGHAAISTIIKADDTVATVRAGDEASDRATCFVECLSSGERLFAQRRI